ncbi:MAG: peptidoglycan editing factor PgeF [bacterium]|nr:peptidoglycan editing factor PgeF [bacterium]MBU1916944.1 peptidoglycan editing factor PgeF [bacterium]
MEKIITASNLSDFPRLIHGFTTKELSNDYDLISQEIGVLPSQIYALKQIHSNQFVCFEKDTELADLPQADAFVTRQRDVFLGVKTADCVPILIYEDIAEVVAAIHAGYKGMHDGIINNTIHFMCDNMGCKIENMFFAIGPCITAKHYEVGPEIIETFQQRIGKQVAYYQNTNERPHLDLRQTTTNILEGLGMHPEHVSHIDMCTYERDDLFYSHRREPQKKRQFSFIGMIS